MNQLCNRQEGQGYKKKGDFCGRDHSVRRSACCFWNQGWK